MKRKTADYSLVDKFKTIQKTIGTFLIICLFVGIFGTSAYASGIYSESGSASNISGWANPVKCNVLTNTNGSGMVIYAQESSSRVRMHVLYIDRNGQITGSLSRDLSGSTWGGCVYRAPDGFTYVATGNSGNTAYFITKFNAGWEKQGSASVSKKDSFTSVAYRAGNCDMALAGSFLIVHAGRRRMNGHQSNETFYIDTKTMSPVYVGGEFGFDHVSHSFSHFVRTKGEQVYLLDQGDGYPRSLYLQAYKFPESAEERANGADSYSIQRMEIMKIWGSTGNNYTGVSLDGFELGSNYNIAVGTSIPHTSFQSDTEFENYSGGRNIYLIRISKDLSDSKLLWLTNYSDGSYVGNIRFIRKTEDMFYILYGRETKSGKNETCCIVVNSDGTVLKRYSIAEEFFCTSEAAILGNQLFWCHYIDSELGCFMVFHTWDLVSGRHEIRNINIGTSKIASILSVEEEERRHEAAFFQDVPKDKVNIGDLEILLGKTKDFEVAVCSKVFDNKFPTAPVVWKSSDPSVISIGTRTSVLTGTIVSYSIIPLSYNIAELKLTGKKLGKSTITVQIGDKTKSFNLRVVKKYTDLYDDEPVVKVSKSSNKPKGTSITTIRPGKKAMTVYWKKQTKNVTGYQIQYALNKKFTKKKKTITVKKNKTVKKKIKKLKGGKKYFVRIRTYRKKGKKTYYSKWSGVKTVKVKK